MNLMGDLEEELQENYELHEKILIIKYLLKKLK